MAALVPPSGLDRRIMRYLAHHRHVRLTWVARHAEQLGDPRLVPVVGIIVVVLVLATRRWATGLALGAAALIAELGSDALKEVFGRPRPPYQLAITYPSGFSFPSSAAMLTMAVALVVVIDVCWPARWLRWPGTLVAGGVVAAIGWAVMYLGAHWLTDVLAGWVLGAVVAVACCRIAPVLVETVTGWSSPRADAAPDR